MSDRIFDEVSKSLAEGIPRREALRRVFGVLAGAVAGGLGLSGRAAADDRDRDNEGDDNDNDRGRGRKGGDCERFCKAHYRNNRDRKACRDLCRGCPTTSTLCGTDNNIGSLTCCAGVCCAGVCTKTASDPNNCGACGKVCHAPFTCVNGQCVCPNGNMACYSKTGVVVCADLRSDPNNCGACGRACDAASKCSNGVCVSTCAAGQLDCNGACVDSATDHLNCGACGVVCPPSMVCQNGACVCPTGTTQCKTPSGFACVDTTSDPNNCGACGSACDAVSACNNGVCVAGCKAPKVDCKGACVDMTSDPNNCGGCGTICPKGTACTGGNCVFVCPPGTTQCSAGACVNLATDPNNCGGCGFACKPGFVCAAGVCQSPCPAPGVICNGICTDTSRDPSNCGTCGNTCNFANAVGACQAGVCVIVACVASYANCNGFAGDGCETNLSTDPNNCGTCGNRCAAPTPFCHGGVCTA